MRRNILIALWFFVSVLTVQLLAPGEVHAAWYDPAWSGRLAVTVGNSGGTDLADFQVHVVLDNSFDFTKAKSDGSDVRFTGSDGTTLINNFWIEKWDSVNKSASIWVKAPSLPVGNTTLYLYYGNASAASISNGSSTFEFFDDFETGSTGTTLTGYFNLGAPQTVLTQSQSWEMSDVPHTLSVVEPTPGGSFGGHKYWGYYGLVGNEGIGLAYSDDLTTWATYSSNPLSTDKRWPSVLMVGSTFYMLYEQGFGTDSSSIVLATSTDGINFTDVKTIVSGVSGFSNQNPNLFYDGSQYYIYWFKNQIGQPLNQIFARSAATPEDLDTASDVPVLQSYGILAAPNVLYYNGTFFLSTEIVDGSGNWGVQVYASDSATSGFSLLPGNPVLNNNSACMFQHVFGTQLHDYSCKLTGSTWTLEHRVADVTTRQQITEKAFDATKWSATGGTWGIVTDTQQDGSSGGVVQGFIGTNDIRQVLLSSYSGSDYVLEAYGKQILGRVWGLGVRATDQNDLAWINLYNDLDGTDNLYVYNLATASTNTFLASAATGTVDANTWYKLSVKSHGNAIDVYKDDVSILSTTDSSSLGSKIALYGEKEAVAEFNNVLVRKYAATEPSVAVIVDAIPPTVTGFTATTPSSSKNIPVTAFTADDGSGVGVGISGYMITQSATPPSVGDANWSGTPPATYTVASDGSYTLYPWAKDDAGNVSALFGSPRTVVVDTIPPTVTISSTGTGPTNTSPIPVTVTFSEVVTGFTGSDVVIGNGALDLVTAVSGTTYTFNVAPTNNGAVTIDIAAGVAQDAAGNGNTAATQFSRIYDTIAPVVTGFTATTPTGSVNIPITAFTATDSVGVTGYMITTSATPPLPGAAGWSGTPPTTYTVAGDGSYTLYPWAKDAAGNVSAVSGLAQTVVVDTIVPTVTISSTAPNPTNTSPIPVTVTFSKPVTGFDSGDVTIGNGTLGLFTAVSGTTYTVTVLPINNGAVTIDIAAGVAHDAANNGNAAATQFSRTYDTIAPTVAIGAPSSSTTKSGPVTFTVTYTGADSVSLVAGNVTLNKTGTADGTVAVTGSGNGTRTVTISNITGNGTLGISIAAGSASDQAGNVAAAAGPGTAFTVDNADGDLNGDGIVDMTDALKVLRIAAGLDTPTASDIAHGDVAPLVSGVRHPDGKIDLGDVVAILRKAALLPSW